MKGRRDFRNQNVLEGVGSKVEELPKEEFKIQASGK